jgi:hypothetical protein
MDREIEGPDCSTDHERAILPDPSDSSGIKVLAHTCARQGTRVVCPNVITGRVLSILF